MNGSNRHGTKGRNGWSLSAFVPLLAANLLCPSPLFAAQSHSAASKDGDVATTSVTIERAALAGPAATRFTHTDNPRPAQTIERPCPAVKKSAPKDPAPKDKADTDGTRAADKVACRMILVEMA